MYRDVLLKELNDYHAYDQKEEADRLGLIDFVKNDVNCFERIYGKPHITASAWIENNEGTSFVLLLHKKLNIWLHPGGHADGDGDLYSVAKKEVLEETGLQNISYINDKIFDIDSHMISCSKGVQAILHYDVRFIFRCDDTEKFNDCDERTDIRWFSQLPQDCSHIQRLYEKWLLSNLWRMA